MGFEFATSQETTPAEKDTRARRRRENRGALPAQQREVRRTRICMVFQHSVLLPNKLVIENVELGLKLRGIALAERRRAEEC